MGAAICNKQACTAALAIRALKGQKDQKSDLRNVQDLWHLCALFSFKTKERQHYILFWKTVLLIKRNVLQSETIKQHMLKMTQKEAHNGQMFLFQSNQGQFLLCPTFESYCICWRLHFVTLCWNGFNIMKVLLTNRLHVSL